MGKSLLYVGVHLDICTGKSPHLDHKTTSLLLRMFAAKAVKGLAYSRHEKRLLLATFSAIIA